MEVYFLQLLKHYQDGSGGRIIFCFVLSNWTKNMCISFRVDNLIYFDIIGSMQYLDLELKETGISTQSKNWTTEAYYINSVVLLTQKWTLLSLSFWFQHYGIPVEIHTHLKRKASSCKHLSQSVQLSNWFGLMNNWIHLKLSLVLW